ncbi:MAG: ArsS family sensor histidine kinase [Campylobacterales bacterium]
MINRNSIFFYITIFFVLMLFVLNALFFMQWRIEEKERLSTVMERFDRALRMIKEGRESSKSRSETKKDIESLLGISIISDKKLDMLKGKTPDATHIYASIYEIDDSYYGVLDDREKGNYMVAKIPKEEQRGSYLYISLLLGSNGVLLAFYLFVLKKLYPLKRLKKQIKLFSDGDLSISTKISGRDEIAEVSNEFDRAIARIRSLEESRSLFLRNIMHELNTPIAKGKLVSEMLEEDKNSNRLKKIFSRLEFLLDEFAKIERVTSGVFELDKKRFRAIDVLDGTKDLLLLEDRELDVACKEPLEFDVDFNLFCIALKNLIDNALKYGEGTPKVLIDKNSISIKSKGEEIENLDFTKAFNRPKETSSKGLGLGLYITSNIIKKHGFELEYSYSDTYNIFSIKTAS